MPEVPLRLGQAALVAGYREGRFSPLEVARTALDRAEGGLARLNGLSSLDHEMTMEAARASAARWRENRVLGPLDGVPISFKDSFHIKGLPRWHGTACHPGKLSAADALPVRGARAAGMIPVCKTAMPDFAMLMSGLSSHHGIIRNAWNPDDSPGGSSSGAGPSVVLGAAGVALGTDMVGSVRLPAALSGLASIKPTQGRIAYDPPGAFRSAGPMAASVDEVELTLAALGHFAEGDHFSAEGGYRPDPGCRPTGRRIALWRRAGWGDATDAETLAAVDLAAGLLADRGAEIVEIADLEADAQDYEAIHWNMLHVGAPDYFGLPPQARGRIHPVIGAMYEALLTQTAIFAAGVRHRLLVASARIAAQLAGFDHVLSPALPVRRFAADLPCPDPGLGMASHQAFACWFNQTGWPAATVPVLDPGDGGVPVSVQIAGKRFDDGGVIGLARVLEAARGFDIRWPSPFAEGAQ
ncbi:amidase [Pseudogemmobacter sonorensis]|uniref:amidase n=1 Tax=Pseudogemmobacter sonorensis TaxID=2989681 RepID=UPI0036B19D33